MSDGSCEASPGYSGLRPRCPLVRESARAPGVALARSRWPRTLAHRQSALTPDAAGRCRDKEGQRRLGTETTKILYSFLLGTWLGLLGSNWPRLSPDASLALHPGGTYSPGPIWTSSPAQQHMFPGRARPVYHLGTGDFQASNQHSPRRSTLCFWSQVRALFFTVLPTGGQGAMGWGCAWPRAAGEHQGTKAG